ncbi:MAG TPA: hypothetical protein VKZ96_12840 [Thermomicrobiales bacterium]|nr:hypothetical protein [Thermomicrobiales bacterium]
MTTATTTHSTHQLASQGFTPEEIARLEALKCSYNAFRERCDSDREFQQLAFLKWRYEHGDLQRG